MKEKKSQLDVLIFKNKIKYSHDQKEDFDNGLSVEQNLRLFHSLDIEEIESLVLLGLKTKNCI